MDPAAARFGGKGPGKWNSGTSGGSPGASGWGQGGKGDSKGGGGSAGGWGQGAASSGGGGSGQPAADTGWGQNREWGDKSGGSNCSWSSSNGWSQGATSQSDGGSWSQWHSSDKGTWNWNNDGSQGGANSSGWHSGGGQSSYGRSEQQPGSYGRNEPGPYGRTEQQGGSYGRTGQQPGPYGRNEQPSKWPPAPTPAAAGFPEQGSAHAAQARGREEPSKWPPSPTAPAAFPERSGGYPAQASGGYPAQASGGYPAQASGGYPPRASGGYPAQAGAGYPAQAGAGYPAQASSGYPTQQAGGGYPAQQASGGYPAQASAGYPAQVPKDGASRSSAPAVSSGAPISLTVSGCQHKTIDRILNGTFVLTGEKHHQLPVYKKNEQISGLNVMLYYWDERDGPTSSGWWFSPEVGDDQVWGHNPERGNGCVPPPVGWNVPCDGPVDPLFKVTPVGGKGAPPPQLQGFPPTSRSSSMEARREEERKRAEELEKQEELRRLEQQKEMHRRKQEELQELQRRKQEEMRQAQAAKRRADEEAQRQREEYERRQREEYERRQWEEMRAQEAKRRAEEEAQRQREEYERRQWEEQQRKLEEQRVVEDMRRKAAEEQQKKMEEARREIEKQRAEEARLRKETQEKKMAEQKAATTIRRVIQKVRVATAANMESLTQELNDTLSEETDNLGGQLQQLKEECEKAVTMAQKRIDQQEEQRQKAEQKKQELEKQRKEKEERVKVVLEELEVYVYTAQTSTGKLKEAMERVKTVDQDREAMLAGMDVVDAAVADAKAASKVCSEYVVGNKGDLKEPDPETKAKLKELLDRIQDCNATNEGAATRMREARSGFEKRCLALEKLKQSQATFDSYDKDADGKLSPEEVLSYAKGEYECDVPQVWLDTIMEHHAEEAGVPFANFCWLKMAVGIEREVQRDRNRHREKLERQEQVSTVKAQLQEKIKDASKVVDEAEQQVVAAEQSLRELKAKSKTDGVKDLMSLARETNSLAEAAKTSVAGARATLAGLSESLNDGYRKELQVWLSSESKRHDIRLGRMDARILRVGTLSRQVRDDAAKKEAMEMDRLRTSAVKVIRHNQMIKEKDTSEAMFDELDAKGDGELDEEEFLAFFEGADKVVRNVLEAPPAPASKDGPKKPEAPDASPAVVQEEAPDANQEAVDANMEGQDASKEAEEGNKEAEEALPEEATEEAAEGARKEATEEASKEAEDANMEATEDGSKEVEDASKEALDASEDAKDAQAPEEPEGAKKTPGDQEVATTQLTVSSEETVVIPPDEAKSLFAHLCGDESSTISREAFVHFMRFYLRVLRAEALSSDISPENSEVLRQLAPKEVVEVLQGPLKEELSGLLRIEVRVFKDGAQGWVSLSGSNSLREGGHVFKVVKETVLTQSLTIDTSKESAPKKQCTRKLKAGEILELLEWPVKEEESGLMRAKVKALNDGEVGFATTVGNQGTMFIDLA